MRLYFLFALLLFPLLIFSQSSKFSEMTIDPGKAKENYVLFSDYLQFEQFKEAEKPFRWLLKNAPNMNVGIYIKGVKLYKELLKQEEINGKDPQKIIKYQDIILKLYEDRITHFGDGEEVRKRIERIFYFFYKDRKDSEKWQKMYDVYQKAFELDGVNSSRSNITFYMLSVVNLKARKVISDVEFFNHYNLITEVIEENISSYKYPEKEKWQDLLDKIEDLFYRPIPIDCDFVREKMSDKILNYPSDIKTSKIAIKYMLKGKCTNDPLFLKAAENVFIPEPTSGLANIISQKYQLEKDYKTAIEWKRKAIELSLDNTEKHATLIYDIALLYYHQDNWIESRKEAMLAINSHENIRNKAYELIGDLYMNSYVECSNSNPVELRSIFLAAYDMYKKAGNQSKMDKAQEQFPSAEEIHTANMIEGDTIRVNCWIDTTTTIRKR